MFSLAWHRGTGSVTSSLHSLFPLEAAVGCLLIWSEILNLRLAVSYKHSWLLGEQLSLLSNDSVYLKDGLPARAQQSGLAVSRTAPVFNRPLFWLHFMGYRAALELHWAAALRHYDFEGKKRQNQTIYQLHCGYIMSRWRMKPLDRKSRRPVLEEPHLQKVK